MDVSSNQRFQNSPSRQSVPEERLLESITVCNGQGSSRKCCECVGLMERVKVLEGALADSEAVIANLREENTRQASQLLEMEIRELQQAISDKDSAIALLEHSLLETTTPTSHKNSGHGSSNKMAGLKQLKKERLHLTSQLKDKVRERLSLFKKNSEDAIGTLATQHQGSTKKQVCDVLRSLERTTASLKAYIDQLLALVLEREPSLMEGLPRIQHETGLDMDLLGVASMTELKEELVVKEQRCDSLQQYADLLLARIAEHDPNLLNTLAK